MFANAARIESTHTHTENGAQALNTTLDSRLDLFSTIGALRMADDQRIFAMFESAYDADPLFATRILFYGRDIRGGLGERGTFRKILKYAANRHPEIIRPNLDLVGFYGRYDDLYSLLDTPLEDDMWRTMKKQWDEDISNMKKGRAISLLAKWVKTADASSVKTKKLGILTAEKLGLSVYAYKRLYRAMRKHIRVVEQLMSQNRWDEIKYPDVPSRAMTLYKNAFKRHDPERLDEFLSKVEKGEEKINASTLYPYDIVRKYLGWFGIDSSAPDKTIEVQWKQMIKDFGDIEESAIVISDTSGSMFCYDNMPIASSLGLGAFFATVNKGAFNNLFMEFSEGSRFIQLRGKTLYDQISNMMSDAQWGRNTNLEAAFKQVLKVAVGYNVSPEEMPKALIVISDMEIDACTHSYGWTFHNNMVAEYAKHGYKLPTIVYWNVNSRRDTFHTDAMKPGCIMISGNSTNTFKQVMKSISMTPIEAMEQIINSERYAPITVD